ncbi:hypothetical protein ABFS82_09G136200 [Erythranthe guttata]|uniref:START domain-containing protein n=1 Tax=Erythranthe guttata TaxID=4155 RepID=A0A022Q228_ERYGU|nr:hypothetical protein MIMGU_mgv1a007377mg [Erythranthe guttata]
MGEEELFWRETQTQTQTQSRSQSMDGAASAAAAGWTWPWTLSVLLVLFTYTLLTSPFCSRFRRRLRSFSSSSSSSISTPAATDSLPSIRTISDLDLKNLIDNLNEEEEEEEEVIWENVIHKTSNSISYEAKCCKPNKDGPLKYLSVTTFEDCSVDKLLNFYMDNNYRVQWDKTVVRHQQLQLDHPSSTEIGRTIKKFPFLTPREYVLAWRLWQGIDGSFYCFCKECEHPLAPKEKGYVRVAVFRSGWRIRKVPGRNACEIRMVHQEDAGLNVEMAKMAFAKGIWSYVCKMDDALRKYSAGGKQNNIINPTAVLPIQKVPREFEVVKDMKDAENSMATVNQQHAEICTSKKLTRRPSSKLIANGLLLLGGAIYLSRGHSSLGSKVAMAYLASKLTKRGGAAATASSKKTR